MVTPSGRIFCSAFLFCVQYMGSQLMGCGVFVCLGFVFWCGSLPASAEGVARATLVSFGATDPVLRRAGSPTDAQRRVVTKACADNIANAIYV